MGRIGEHPRKVFVVNATGLDGNKMKLSRHKIMTQLYNIVNLDSVDYHKARPFTKMLIRNCGTRLLIGAEVGVSEGLNADNILRLLNIEMLYLIDPYEKYLDHDGLADRRSLYCVTDHSMYEQSCHKRLEKYNGKVVYIKRKSTEAADCFKDNSLDFVYIDAGHKYEDIYNDLKSWHKKATYVGGHDFDPGLDVSEAVMDFCRKYDRSYFGLNRDWWLVPGEIE